MKSNVSLNAYRLLGRSGLRVSPLALGTMTFGSDWGWGADAQEARSIFDAYVDREGNLVDRSVIANPFPKAGHLAQPANGSRYPGTLLHPLGISAVVGAEPSRMIR